MNDDTELLRRFADEGAQEALAELVRRKVNLVYAAALRQTGGDAHLAQDVTQGVFLALARKAAILKRHAVLTGWLYTTTRFVAAKAVRTQTRWQRREQEAITMNTLAGGTEPAWNELRPVIDEAMHELGEQDRAALLLRYFEAQPLAAVGAALNVTENAARMRVDRALEKLRDRLARRGITSTAAALGVALAAQPAITAPAGLAATSVTTALAGALSGTFGGGAFALAGKKLAAVLLAAAAGVGAAWTIDVRHETRAVAEENRQRGELGRLRMEQRRLDAEIQQVAQARARQAASRVVDPLGRLRAAVAVVEESGGPMRWSYFRWEPVVTPAATNLFGLTEAERAALETAVETARREMVEAVIAGAQVQRAENQVTVDIASPPGATAIWTRLQAAFQRTLGEERYALHEKIGWADGVRQLFNNLGLTPLRLVIAHDTAPRRPEYPYSLSQTRPTAGGGRGGTGGGGGGGMDRAALKLNLGPFDVWVPPEF